MIKKIAFLLKNKVFRASAVRKYKELLSNDRLSKQDLDKLNFEKRKNIVNFAYLNVPFYRDFYNSKGFDPKKLVNEEDWALVPVLTKQDIRENFDSLIATNAYKKRYVLSSTGGTSGEPLKVLHDKGNFLDVYGWRVFDWWDISLGTNIAFVFRLVRGTRIKKIINSILWYPTNRVFLDASNVSEQDIQIFIKTIKRNKTKVIQGYTGAVNEVANYIINNNIKINGIEAIWTTSSPMTHSIRKNIEKAFDSKVYDQYGSGEVYWIATECSVHKGLHVHSDVRQIDIVDDNYETLPDGEVGNILVSDLDNYIFPIIRYKNGDLSSFSTYPCDCERPYKLLEKIYGRVSDLIKLPNGSFISGDYFTTIFDDFTEDVNAFQVHQSMNGDIDIRITYKLSCKEKFEIEDFISNNVKNKVKNLVNVKIIEVDNLNNNILGKNRFVTSEIS
jgi:phenylacetate-CoA ligase